MEKWANLYGGPEKHPVEITLVEVMVRAQKEVLKPAPTRIRLSSTRGGPPEKTRQIIRESSRPLD